MSNHIENRSIPKRIMAFAIAFCLLLGIMPQIAPPVKAVEVSIAVATTLIESDVFSIRVHPGATPTFELDYTDTHGVTHTLDYGQSNYMHSAIAAAQAANGGAVDPMDPAFWLTPGIIFNNPTGRSDTGRFTNVQNMNSNETGNTLFASVTNMYRDDLINNNTGESVSDGKPDTLILVGPSPKFADVTIKMIVSLRQSGSGKVDTCRYTVEAINNSTTQAYAYGLAWSVDTQVGAGTGAGGAGDSAKFRGQGINKFSTGDLAVKFPTPSVSPWVGWPMPNGEPVNSTLFTNDNNTYQNSVPAYLYAVNRDFDEISAVFYPQISNDRAYPGVTFRSADFVAMDRYSLLTTRYFYNINESAARTSLSTDSGHIVRYDPELLLPGQSLVYGIDYGMGQAVTVSSTAPWLAVDMPELKLEELNPGQGYGADRVTMNLRYGNGVNAVTTYRDASIRMFLDPTYLSLESSMTSGGSAVWVRNAAADTGGLQAWELQVCDPANSASALAPGADNSAIPPVYLIGTPVYADINPGTAWVGAETPLRFELIIRDSGYMGGISNDMRYNGEVLLGLCQSFTLGGFVWRDVNSNGTHESFEGVQNVNVVLVNDGNPTPVGTAQSALQGVVSGPLGITDNQLQHLYLNLPAGDFTYATKDIKVWVNNVLITGSIVPADNHPIFESLNFNGYYNGNRALSYKIKAGQVAQIEYEVELALGAVVDVYAFLQGTNKLDSSTTQPGGTIDINGANTPFAINRLHTQRSVAGSGISVVYTAPPGYRMAGTYALQATQTLLNLGSFAEGHRYTMDFEVVNKDLRLTGISNSTNNVAASTANPARSAVTLFSMDWLSQTGQLDFSQSNLSTNRTDYTWSVVSDPQGILVGGVSNTGNVTFHNSNLGTAVVKVASTAEPNLSHEMEITLQTGTSATIDRIYIARASDLNTPITSMALTKGGTEDMVLVGVNNGTGALTKLPNSNTFTSGDASTLTLTPSGSDPYIYNMYGVNGGYTSISASYQTHTASANVLVTNQPLAGASIRITPNPIALSSSQTETVTYALLFANGTTQVIPATVVNASIVNTGIATVSSATLTYVSDGSTTLNAVLVVDNSVTGSATVNAASGGAPVTGNGTLRLQESSATGGFIPVGGPAEYFAYLDANDDGQYNAGDTILPYSSVNVNYLSQYSKFSMAAGAGDNVRITGTTTGMDQLVVEYTDAGTTYRASTNVVVHSAGYTYTAIRVVPSPLVLEVGATQSLNVYAEFTNAANATERHLLHHSMYTGSIAGTAAALVAGTQNQVVGVNATNECTYTATLNTDTSKTGTAKILVIPVGAYLDVTPGVLWIEKGSTGNVTYVLRSQGGNVITFPNLTDYISASVYNTAVANFAGGNITTLDGLTVGRTAMDAYLSGQASNRSVTIYVWDDSFNGTTGVEWDPGSLSINAGYTDNASLWLLDAQGNRVTTVDLSDLIASGTLTSADTSIATIPSNPSGPSLVVTGGNVAVTSNTNITAVCPAGNADLAVTVVSNAVVHGLTANPQIIELWPGETKSVTITDAGLGTALNAAQLGALTSVYANAGENLYTVNATTQKLDITQDIGVPASGSVNTLTLNDGTNSVVVYIINHTDNPYQAGFTRELSIDPELASVALGGTTNVAARLTVTDGSGTVVDNIILPAAVVTWQANTTTALSGRVSLAASTAASQTVEITGTQPGAQTYRVNYAGGTSPLSGTGRVFVYAQPTTDIQTFELVPSTLTLSIGDMDAIQGKITYNNSAVQTITAQELPYAVPNLASASTSIATVSATGMVEGKAVGNTTVSGTLLNTNHTGSVAVNVLSGWTVSGTVINAATSAPIPNADVSLNGTVVATTNASGMFSIPGVVNGMHTISADATGYVSNQTTVNVSGGNMPNVVIQLTPIPAATYAVSGTVTDAVSTLPISGATVIAGGLSTTTDSNGDYTLSLSDGTYTVTASMSGYTANTANVTVNGAAETGVDIALNPFAGNVYIVMGKVTNANDGSNIAGAQIQVGGNVLTLTDSNGNYSVSLPDGTHIITANAGAAYSVEASAPFVVNGGNVIGINLALTPLAPATYTVSGQVTDSGTGNPIVGATVTLGGTLTATTDNNGDYILNNVPSGNHIVGASAIGYAPNTLNVTVSSGNVTNADIALSALGGNTVSVSGQVTDLATGNPIPGATVTIAGQSAVTNANGDYIVNNVPDGATHNAVASATTYTSGSITVTTIGQGQNVTGADIRLGLAPISVYTISGKVTNTSGVAIAGASVTAFGQTVLTNATGDYIISGVVSGTYIIAASASGYSNNNISRTVATANVTGADITLSTSGGGNSGGGNSGGGSSGGGSSSSGYDVRYEANGGTGGKTVSGITSGSQHTVLDATDADIKYTGQNFLGWNTQKDGKGTSYAPGAKITVTETVVLYAQWRDEVALDTDNHFAYLRGDTQGTFRPNANMTRAETAQMLYNLLLDKTYSQTVSFSDLPGDAWYTEAVKALAAKGVISGYPDGTFRPDAPISRSEFVAMLSRFTSISSGEMIFSDIPGNHWAYQYIVSATTKGWIKGYPDGTFRPGQSITRAEAAKVTNALLNRSADEAYVDAHTSINRFPDVEGSWAYYEIMEATVSHDFTRTQSGGEIWTAVSR